MALVLHDNPNEIHDTGNQMKELESVKADTSLLASNSDSLYMNVRYMHIIYNSFQIINPYICSLKIRLEMQLIYLHMRENLLWLLWLCMRKEEQR